MECISLTLNLIHILLSTYSPVIFSYNLYQTLYYSTLICVIFLHYKINTLKIKWWNIFHCKEGELIRKSEVWIKQGSGCRDLLYISQHKITFFKFYHGHQPPQRLRLLSHHGVGNELGFSSCYLKGFMETKRCWICEWTWVRERVGMCQVSWRRLFMFAGVQCEEQLVESRGSLVPPGGFLRFSWAASGCTFSSS
jgi:hypothetical protein